MSVAIGIVCMALSIVSEVSADQGDAVQGKVAYTQYCASCHGNTGKGDGPAAASLSPKPRDLTDKDYMATLEDSYLTDIINKGGAAVGKSALMPPWSAVLKKEDLQNVIAYIRGLGH
ncbi:MAG: cytochrome c [Candidatus Tectomicrobia bacterium]|nr:cytochrome c [Candidatus Tectomicrobia bacterium]